jgi:hypothetical protein
MRFEAHASVVSTINMILNVSPRAQSRYTRFCTLSMRSSPLGPSGQRGPSQPSATAASCSERFTVADTLFATWIASCSRMPPSLMHRSNSTSSRTSLFPRLQRIEAIALLDVRASKPLLRARYSLFLCSDPSAVLQHSSLSHTSSLQPTILTGIASSLAARFKSNVTGDLTMQMVRELIQPEAREWRKLRILPVGDSIQAMGVGAAEPEDGRDATMVRVRSQHYILLNKADLLFSTRSSKTSIVAFARGRRYLYLKRATDNSSASSASPLPPLLSPSPAGPLLLSSP